jgi:uncharacterized lipoprotein YajG
MQRVSRGLALVALAALALGGCASRKILDVGLKPTDAGHGPLGSAPPVTVRVAELTDKRPEPERIGYTKNTFGGRSADLVTGRPVPAIVRDAIVAEFAASGHRVGPDADILVSGTITAFWFELSTGGGSFELTADVGADVTLSDGPAGRLLLTRAYRGHYAEKTTAGALESTWQRVMNTALQRMVREIASDPGLLAALRERGLTRATARER